ncbi:Filamentous hemagglutinin family N-terminal domain [Hyella patelloides LEGE 07179]|uniref:Filamentous hemagglutinin family N-terminal domain n=1 Tax=Hyella patelloides LEGE 07179 TaxID=945734 RepID=A0A563W171_9CYAN|nr:S-layer family protein [Hyella patelloides]VEP17410.1 Filamentous hemagglutinin family N-terminal domain [Hyella patelloides LEGE 07179]
MKVISKTVFCLFPLLFPLSATAQITVDGTTSTTVTPTETGVQIDDGNRAGGNLYHSFGEFSIPTGSEAFFNNASEIANIFSRVTGGNISNINGLIRANGAANLFLINPAGIVFGNDARLQLGGSFYGSTADSIIFPDGEFSATDLDNPPLITVNAPIGLGFRDNPGEITVRGNGNGIRLIDSEVIDTQEALRVGTENTIGLIGGNLILENATIKTAGGSIELGSVAGGDVDLVTTAKGFTFDYSGIENFSDISLTGISVVDASGLGGGDINVVGNNISLTGISGLTNYTLGGNPGGDTNVFAAESLEINGIENELDFFSGIANYVLPQGTADGGDINIEAQNLRIGDRGEISTFAFGQGNAGNININASESVSLASEGNGSAIGSVVNTDGVEDGGDVSITTPNLTISNGASLVVTTLGAGDGGKLTINTENFNLADGSVINVLTSGTGDGGSLTIDTNNLLVTNGSEINTSTLSSGNAGDLQITATDIELNGGDNGLETGLSSAVAESTSEGNAGNITIETPQLRLVNGGAILVSTVGGGDGGDLRIQATDISLENPMGVFTVIDASTIAEGAGGSITIETGNLNLADGGIISVLTSGIGDGGSLTIDTNNLLVTNGSQISTNTIGAGNGGNLQITATDIELNGGDNGLGTGLSSAVAKSTSEGNAGNITVETQQLSLVNGGAIAVSTIGGGNGGDLRIQATDISLENPMGAVTIIDASTFAEGKGGSINIETGNLNLADGGIINVLTSGTGDGGSLTIDTNNLLVTNGSEINTSTLSSGNAGDLQITATDIELNGGDNGLETGLSSAVAESTSEGNAGNITIETPQLRLVNGGAILVSTVGGGDGGDLRIQATDISLENLMGANTIIDASTFAGGAGGSITIETENLNLTDGSIISVFTLGTGDGGSLTINSDSLLSTNGSTIDASTFSSGNAGDLEITATDIELNGGENGLLTSLTSIAAAEGNAGNITIETPQLRLANGGQISVSTGGEGDGGNLQINANQIEIIEAPTGESLTGISAFTQAEGAGGSVTIETESLNLIDGGIIDVSTSGTGDSGNLTIEANSIDLENNSRINAETQSGTGGNIDFQIAENLTLSDNSSISARANNDANGGNINIGAEFIIAYPSGGNSDGNDITASAQQGQGGAISITAESLLGIEERRAFDNNGTNDIDASSGTEGLDGTVTIETPDNNPLRETTELTDNVVTAEVITTSDVCSASDIEDVSSLAVQGKGGVAPEPTAPFDGDALIVNGEPETSDAPQNNSHYLDPNEIPPHIQPVAYKDNGEPIYIARGVMKQEDGTVILTAVPHQNQNIPPRTPENPYSCGQ